MIASRRSSLALRAILQLLHSEDAVLEVPLLVADPLHEVGLRLDHHDATPEADEGLRQCLHRLHVEVVRGLVDCDEVGLCPEHGGEGKPHLLAGGEAPYLPVAAHLLVDAKGLAVPDDLPAGQGALVQARGLRGDALVAGDDDLLQAHGLELRDGLHCVLLRVVQPLPAHLVGELRAQFRPADELLDLIPVLAVLLPESLAALRLVVVLGLHEALLQVAVVAVLEALRDVDEGRGVEEGPQRLEVVLLHVRQPEVAVPRDLAILAVLVLRGACLTAEERHEGRLPASVPAADRHARVQAELHGGVLDEVVLVLGVPEGRVLGLQHGSRAGLHALHGAGDGEAQLWRPRDSCDLGVRPPLARALLVLARLLRVEGEVARQHGVDLVLGEALLRGERAEVALGVLELLVYVSEDVRAHFVQELRLVGDHHDGRVLDRQQVVAEPHDRLFVEVVGGLVEQDEVRRLQHGDSERHPHPPARREVGHGLLKHLLWEADVQQRVPPGIVDADVLGHLDDVLEGGEAALAHQPQFGVVDVDTLEVLRHTHNGVVHDLLHQRRLPRAVLPDHAVTVVLLHLQQRVLEQQVAGAIHEQEVLDPQERVRAITLRAALRVEGVP
mmetsp:Transcript_80923/g.229223  ORF Transcript_80923/g.229223 Transcript_80923/m.229223 type:complete len:613 (-) Transcript_80923:401-2239(-)